mmetsp:Transcript_7311/g.14651  ORF Transcript_7311/g.14651 Transcript_7311/m.14651 type:complete len:125 (-) Transcript_7311:684-1058(-)
MLLPRYTIQRLMDVVSLFAQRFHGLRLAQDLAVAVVDHAETLVEVGTIAVGDTTTGAHTGIPEEGIMIAAIMIVVTMTAAIMTVVMIVAIMTAGTDMMVGKYITVWNDSHVLLLEMTQDVFQRR